jgi:ribosomal subunit interface protein
MTNVEIVVHGRHVDVSSRFRDQVSDKLARIDRFGIQISRVDVELSQEKNPRLSDRAFEVEITCRSKGPVIRAEAWAADKYSAMDVAIGRIEEQLRRAHDRSKDHRKLRMAKRKDDAVDAKSDGIEPVFADSDLEFVDVLDDEVYAQGPVVVRNKVHAATPMSIAQAVDQMELVGHDFFLFQEIDSSKPAVVYRRRGFDYGLIRIETAASNGAANGASNGSSSE